VAELAVIIVAYNSREWLAPCLTSLARHTGGTSLDVVVVDNDSSDGSAELVERDFPDVKVLRERNGGFAYGNNRGLDATDSEFMLFLNADAELVEGTLAGQLAWLRAHPEIGLIGCRQLDHAGRVYPTMRRFPSVARFACAALGSESWPFRASWTGERELDLTRYDADAACDWVSGSYMLARRDAVAAVGAMDEAFFLYFEEPDLCLRLKRAGWGAAYVPGLTIRHPWDRGGLGETLVAQDAYARRQYLAKHFGPVRRRAALAAVIGGHALRAARGRRASRRALRVLTGREGAPLSAAPARRDELEPAPAAIA
jgi:GT2 family glycosyltransferase